MAIGAGSGAIDESVAVARERSVATFAESPAAAFEASISEVSRRKLGSHFIGTVPEERCLLILSGGGSNLQKRIDGMFVRGHFFVGV
jgi:hypothetical protein